jgi:arsenate reductase-like glutaredoxin family protein
VFDDLLDELRDMLDQRNSEIEAIANEMVNEEELQAFIAQVDSKFQELMDELEKERETMLFVDE